jgi:hypothetical protein
MQTAVLIQIVVSLLFNALLAVLAFWFYSDAFTADLCAVWAVATTSTLAAISTLIGFFIHDYGERKALLALLIHALCLILCFAGIYRGFGLAGRVLGPGDELLEPALAAYFSIVTWTTLGYGDYQPAPALRLLAGLEALLGYIFLGLIVGLAANLVVKRKELSR